MKRKTWRKRTKKEVNEDKGKDGERRRRKR